MKIKNNNYSCTTDRKKRNKVCLAAIERLIEEKYNINFILVENKTNDEVLEICKSADIIIDQLVLESHGIFPLEGMHWENQYYAH